MLMYIVNIDPNFFPRANIHFTEIGINLFQFSGGEWHVKIRGCNLDSSESVLITNRFNSTDDLMKVLLVKDALELSGFKRFELIMPYVPYARQDRQCASGESFSLKVFSKLLNSAKFDEVIILDAHSDVAPALIDNSVNISNTSYVEQAVKDIFELNSNPELYLISPDSGANKKTNKLFSSVSGFTNIIKCDKKRDLITGSLNGFEVFAQDLNGVPCLIVDDICDGGRTFTGIAEQLKEKNAGDLFLFVTHGIFSAGLGVLNSWFTRIYTTNSIKDLDDPKLVTFKI